MSVWQRESEGKVGVWPVRAMCCPEGVHSFERVEQRERQMNRSTQESRGEPKPVKLFNSLGNLNSSSHLARFSLLLSSSQNMCQFCVCVNTTHRLHRAYLYLYSSQNLATGRELHLYTHIPLCSLILWYLFRSVASHSFFFHLFIQKCHSYIWWLVYTYCTINLFLISDLKLI